MRPRDIALAVSVAVIWGFAFLATEFALESFTAPQLVAIRFILAALPVLFIRKPDLPWTTLILLGSFIFTGQFLFQFFGYEAGMPPGLTSVATHTQALFTILIAAAVLHERPRPRQVAGVVAAFAGLAMVALSIGGEITFLGLALTLTGAVSWSIGNVMLKRLPKTDMLSLMTWLCLVPPLPALCVSVAMGDDPGLIDALFDASARSLLAAVFLGVISTAVAFAVWGRLLNTYPTVMVTPFALAAPVTGIIASYFVFGEAFGPLRGTGMALILGGIAMTVLGGGRRSEQKGDTT